MVNSSKIRSKVYWKKLEDSGAIGTLESAQRYSHLRNLNRDFPIESVLSWHLSGISRGDYDHLNRFTMGSPLGDSQYEHHLNAVLVESAKSHRWVASRRPEGQMTPGLREIVGIGFGITYEHKGFVYLVPTQKFIEYCQSRNKPSKKN